MKSKLVLFALCCGIALPAAAADIACPDLAAATQVAACPTEEELKYTFMGYCGDNARLYGQDAITCTSLENYKKLKNNALWEAAGGDFQGYVSCDLDPAAVKAAKPLRITVGKADKAGKLTRIACEYDNEIVFAHRTRAACKVAGDGDCGSGKSCKAACD
jgi:hypothetical protein